MRRLLFIFSIFFYCICLEAQRFPETEVIFQTRGASSSQQEIAFDVKSLEYEYWEESEVYIFNTFTYRYYAPGCNVGIQPVNTSVKLKGNVACTNSGLEYIFYGENWTGDLSCSGNAEYRPFANALYEIRISVDNVFKFKFYLDPRHDNLPNGCSNNCDGNDISIVYFINDNTVRGAGGFWSGGDYMPIEYDHYYTWWELRRNDCSIALSKFNEKYMPILLEPVNQNYRPFLEWIKPSSLQAETDFILYDLQRSINNGPFETIFRTEDFNTTSYLDWVIYWNPGQTNVTAIYRVAAIYTYYFVNYADVSNYREINSAQVWINWKLAGGGDRNKTEYYLSDNFPNPFNPVTSILYYIPEDGYISLIIYDIIGREIIRLIDEYKKQGEYIIDFNAADLNSGVYFYTLKTANYTKTKHMLLIK